MLFKSTLRQISHSLGRYLAIFAIVALGVGFFVGLRVSKDAMIKTGENYFEELKLYDFRLVSTLGLTPEDVSEIKKLDFVDTISGSVSSDVLFVQQNGANGVLHVHSLLSDLNGLDLVAGRLPQSADEIVVDGKYYSASMLDHFIELSRDNDASTFETFSYDKYKVVGIVSSSYYINFERGSSSLGGVSGFAYILPEGFTSEVYTEIFLRLREHPQVYSKAYDTYAGECETKLKEALEARGQIRYEKLREDGNAEIREADLELIRGRKEYEDKKKEVYDAFQKAEDELMDKEAALKAARTELSVSIARYEDNDLLFMRSLDQYTEATKSFEETKHQMPPQMAAQMEQELIEQGRLLAATKAQLDAAHTEIEAAKKTIDENSQLLEDGKKELAQKKEEAEDELARAEKELEEARQKIEEAIETIAQLKEPATFVLGRSTNIGYASLENDTNIVSGIAKVFPLFFFLVAALVCITTMTRMVDDQRIQNGTLKALGYTDAAIAGQYLFYAGSASVTGCLLGFLLGSKFMPYVLWEIYHIMYAIDRPIVYYLDWGLFAGCLVLYLVATLGTTFLAVRGDLREAAAQLIRPKAPVAGKRVFLEYIGFLWKRIKFLHKVSIRNILLYKKRMFMMMIGVGGCTALLLTGFGIRDSIQPILDYQFHEIHCYDMVVSFLEPQTETDQTKLIEKYQENLRDLAFVHMESMDLVTNGSADSVTLVAADKLDKNLVNLHNGKTEYAWPQEGETIINYRLARDNNLKIGDTIEFRSGDYQVLSVKVVGIFDNYLRDYAYISTETYAKQFGTAAKMNSCYVNVSEKTTVTDCASDFLKEESVSSVSVSQTQIDMVGNMLSSLDYVVLIVLVCAGALAFIVIYNLTNISINERIREIATIKVLGFYEREAAAYVFRENLVLSFLSSLVGLVMGVFLHRFVMSQIAIKSMYFGHRILPMSFVWSVIITFLFAVIVDVVMFYRLKTINMAESLKAIE